MPCFPWGSFWWVFPLAMLAMFAIGLILFRRLCWTGAGGGRRFGWCCSGSSPGDPDALETLKRRYASGELTKEVFDGMKRELLE
jgi:putative membrane protein